MSRLSLHSLGSQFESGGGNGHRRVPIFFLTWQIHCPLAGIGSLFCGLFPRGAGSALLLSFSKEVDMESVEYSPPQSPQYEELLEVVARAVAKLNIDWPAEKQAEPQKSKLDECFLRTKPLPKPAFFSRCQDRGGNHSRPAYSCPPLVVMAMWWGWVTAVTERCPRLSRCLRAICPPARHHLWRLWSCPPSRCAKEATSALVGKG